MPLLSPGFALRTNGLAFVIPTLAERTQKTGKNAAKMGHPDLFDLN